MLILPLNTIAASRASKCDVIILLNSSAGILNRPIAIPLTTCKTWLPVNKMSQQSIHQVGWELLLELGQMISNDNQKANHTLDVLYKTFSVSVNIRTHFTHMFTH